MHLQVAPGAYCREAGALAKAGYYASRYGSTACLIGGRTALGAARGEIIQSLDNSNITVTGELHFGGECSWTNAEALARRPEVKGADVLFGIGGGKALDTAKLAAYRLNKPLITVPTIAATCAAWTPLSVVYDKQGAFVEVSYEAANPSAVLADTAVMLYAPTKYIIAGIGDTLAKWYEGEACTRGRAVTLDGSAGLSLAKTVCDRLLEKGPAAVRSARDQSVSCDFEEAVDAIIMYAGIVSNVGGDACRAAAAHSIYSAFTILPPMHSIPHGAVVSFGILCQMIMDRISEREIDEFLEYSASIGLPITLRELALDGISPGELRRVAEVSLGIPEMSNMPYEVTADMVFQAITAADEKGQKWRQI